MHVAAERTVASRGGRIGPTLQREGQGVNTLAAMAALMLS
jgi:hypothetical protein